MVPLFICRPCKTCQLSLPQRRNARPRLATRVKLSCVFFAVSVPLFVEVDWFFAFTCEKSELEPSVVFFAEAAVACRKLAFFAAPIAHAFAEGKNVAAGGFSILVF